MRWNCSNQIGYYKVEFYWHENDELDTEEQYKELRKDEPKIEKKELTNPNADNYEFYINPQIDQT